MKNKLYNYSFNFSLRKNIFFPTNILELKKFVKKKNYSIVGNLRSYNDAAIGNNPLSVRNFKKIINFIPQKKLFVIPICSILFLCFLKPAVSMKVYL